MSRNTLLPKVCHNERDQLYEHWAFIDKMKLRGTVFPNFLASKRKKGWIRSFKRMMTGFTQQLSKGQKAAAPYHRHGPERFGEFAY